MAHGRGGGASLALLLMLVAAPAHAEEAGPEGPAIDAAPAALDGHVMVEIAAADIRVTEVYALVAGARVAPRGGEADAAAPWIPLPASAGELRVERGGDLLGYVPGGLVLVAPLEPGRHALAFSFVVPAEGGRATIAHALPFAVETLRVMWRADLDASVRAAGGFADHGVLEMGPRRMQVLVRETFPAGGLLTIETDRGAAPGPGDAPPAPGAPRSLVLPVVAALAAVLLVAALSPLLSRSRRRPRA